MWRRGARRIECYHQLEAAPLRQSNVRVSDVRRRQDKIDPVRHWLPYNRVTSCSHKQPAIDKIALLCACGTSAEHHIAPTSEIPAWGQAAARKIDAVHQ